MLNIDSRKVRIDFNRYTEILNKNLCVYFDTEAVRKELAYTLELQKTMARQMRELVRYRTDYEIDLVGKDKNKIIEYLTEYDSVPEKMFVVRNYNGDETLSISKSDVFIPMINQNYGVEFADIYIPFASYLTKYQRVSSLYNKYIKKCNIKSYNGSELGKLTFRYEPSDTGRYYTKDYSTQNINKDILKHIVAPEGRMLFWGDFGQIDLRVGWNLILKTDEVNKVFEKFPDKYEAVMRVIHLQLGREFNEDWFKLKRNSFKKAVLSRMYGASLGSLINETGDVELSQLLDEFYKKNEKYQSYKTDIESTFRKYQSCSVVDYFNVYREVDSRNGYNHSVRAALNTPIQSTSNCIVMLYLFSIIDKIIELGLPEDWVVVYMLRHDEIVFSLDQRMIDYMWVFEDSRHVFVDDWGVIAMSSAIGYRYCLEDEELTEKMYNNINANLDKLSKRVSNPPVGKKFNPLVHDLRVGLQVLRRNNKKVMFAYAQYINKYYVAEIDLDCSTEDYVNKYKEMCLKIVTETNSRNLYLHNDSVKESEMIVGRHKFITVKSDKDAIITKSSNCAKTWLEYGALKGFEQINV